MLEYATVVGGETVVKTKFAGKGLNSDDLTVDAFEAMDAGGSMKSVAKFQMKKIAWKRNSTQKENDVFSVYHTKATDMKADGVTPKLQKVVNVNKWAGRVFIGNSSVPYGYVAKD